jgi:hypothetical protein
MKMALLSGGGPAKLEARGAEAWCVSRATAFVQPVMRSAAQSTADEKITAFLQLSCMA